ncbi:MAG: 1-acyl-sn-glycerol-3-phosphate acyltransferase [Candidatus Neomarinimicrobiota bacterium]|nr:1-acyl-sn-glycerol-3-phosphate acyltransferase [Candidatus Neomarinimicrobiota bacterium]
MSVSVSAVPLIHRAHRWFLSRLARILLYLSNWRVKGSVPDFSKLIVIGAPHSSLLDAYYVLLAVWALDVKVNFLGAVWMFSRLPILDALNGDNDNPDIYGIRWPLGWLQKIIVRKLGGIPVYRSSPQGTVNQLAETIHETDNIVLMMAPEGGMAPTKKFKSGFYVLSRNLDLPILPIQFDYDNRCFNLLEAFHPSGNVEDDMKHLRALFDRVEGKNHTFMA